jgi:hypothetical protein
MSERIDRNTTDADVVMRRLVLIVVAFAAVLTVPLLFFGIYVDRRFNALERDLQYEPPEARSDIAIDELPPEAVSGQVVYVPAYSHVYHQSGKPQLLTVTLSIRNTDRSQDVIISVVDYFDSAGKRVKSYLSKPLRVAPLASTEFLVERQDTSGGSGANFLVHWFAAETVTEPIIETVMIDTSSRQGISFVRAGKVISEITPKHDDENRGPMKKEESRRAGEQE